MPHPLSIRLLEEQDLDRVADFERAIALASFPDDPVTDLAFYRRKLLAAVGRPGALVADLDGQAVGWAWVAERENFTTKERYCDFRSLYVAPGRRGTGAAFALLNACLDYCEINGLSRIVGRTSAENEAMQALYRRYSFAPKHIVFERRVDLPPGKPRPKVSEPRRPADPPRPTGGETRYRRRPGSRSP